MTSPKASPAQAIKREIANHAKAIHRYIGQQQASRPGRSIEEIAASDYVRGRVGGIRKTMESATPELATSALKDLDAKIQTYFDKNAAALRGFEAWETDTRKSLNRMFKELDAWISEVDPATPRAPFDAQAKKRARSYAEEHSPISAGLQDRIIANNVRFSKLEMEGNLDSEGAKLKEEQNELLSWLVSPAMGLEREGGVSSFSLGMTASSSLRDESIGVELTSSGLEWAQSNLLEVVIRQADAANYLSPPSRSDL